jgi:hypothetical protein
MNHVLHVAAIAQIRHDTEGCAYYRRKLAESKTPMKALRLRTAAYTVSRTDPTGDFARQRRTPFLQRRSAAGVRFDNRWRAGLPRSRRKDAGADRADRGIERMISPHVSFVMRSAGRLRHKVRAQHRSPKIPLHSPRTLPAVDALTEHTTIVFAWVDR